MLSTNQTFEKFADLPKNQVIQPQAEKKTCLKLPAGLKKSADRDIKTAGKSAVQQVQGSESKNVPNLSSKNIKALCHFFKVFSVKPKFS